MPDTILSIPADLRRDLAINEIKSTIVDVPTVRKHKLSSLSVTAQSYVIVELLLGNGVIGIGEAATLGGPRWSEESVESIKATIDTYLAPALIGSAANRFETARVRMDEAAKRNNAAKGAIDSALFDAVGKTVGVPAVQLLGGVVRERVPVLWTLASGDPVQEIDEAEKKIAAGLHNIFKVKIGAQPPEADMARMQCLAIALEGRASLIVDANQAWDETTALRCLPVLAEIGVTLIEQPLPAWNILGMARLRTRSTVPLMADECVFSTHDMLDVGTCRGCRCCIFETCQTRWSARDARRGFGGPGGGHRPLWRLPAGKLHRRGGSPASLRCTAGSRLGLRAFRPADPDRRSGDRTTALRGFSYPPADRPRSRRHTRSRAIAPIRATVGELQCYIASKWKCACHMTLTRPTSTV